MKTSALNSNLIHLCRLGKRKTVQLYDGDRHLFFVVQNSVQLSSTEFYLYYDSSQQKWFQVTLQNEQNKPIEEFL